MMSIVYYLVISKGIIASCHVPKQQYYIVLTPLICSMHTNIGKSYDILNSSQIYDSMNFVQNDKNTTKTDRFQLERIEPRQISTAFSLNRPEYDKYRSLIAGIDRFQPEAISIQQIPIAFSQYRPLSASIDRFQPKSTAFSRNRSKSNLVLLTINTIVYEKKHRSL